MRDDRISWYAEIFDCPFWANRLQIIPMLRRTTRSSWRHADCRSSVVCGPSAARMRHLFQRGLLMLTTRRSVLAGGAAMTALLAGCGRTGAGGATASNPQLATA